MSGGPRREEAREGCMWTRLLRRAASRPPRRCRSSCRTLWAFLALAGALMANRARAEGESRLTIDWEKLGNLLRRDSPSAASPASWRAELSPPAPSFTESPLLEGFRGMSGLSLVARDWDAAKLLMGRLSAVDQVQHGRSWRMALLRARFAEGPLVPFAQLGLGQWRVDPDMPAIRHEQVFAGQLGGGVELVLSSWASIALEADCSMLVRERRLDGPDGEPRETASSRPGPALDGLFGGTPDETSQAEGAAAAAARWIHPPAVWGTFLAARATF